MKNLVIILVALVMTGALAYAQTPAVMTNSTVSPVVPVAMPTSGTLMAPSSAKTLNGTVKSVSMADAAKGTKTQIVVADDAGKTTDVLVKATTTLYDIDAKATTLDKIAAGSKVNVVYTTTPEGIDEAKFIKVVK